MQTLELGELSLVTCLFKSPRLVLANFDLDAIDGTVKTVGNLLSREAILDGRK